MRNFEDRKNEIIRRSQARIKRRNTTKKVILTCVPCILILSCFSVVLFTEPNKKDADLTPTNEQLNAPNYAEVFFVTINNTTIDDKFLREEISKTISNIIHDSDEYITDYTAVNPDRDVPCEPNETFSSEEITTSVPPNRSDAIGENATSESLLDDSVLESFESDSVDKNEFFYKEELTPECYQITIHYSDKSSRTFVLSENILEDTENNISYSLKQSDIDLILELIK